jgi:hypothetical protein
MFAILLTLAPAFSAAPSSLPVVPQSGAQEAELQSARVKKGQTAQIRPFFDRKTPMMLDLPEGSLLQVVRQEVPWSEVRIPGGLEVWVHGDYVTWKDGLVYPKTSRLRARPLPSTSGNSHPVGKLSTDWGMTVLDQNEAWLKVLAPEELSAWVLTEQIVIDAQLPIGWNASWNAEASKRRKAVLATAVPVAAPVDPAAEAGEVKVAGAGTQPPVDAGTGLTPPAVTPNPTPGVVPAVASEGDGAPAVGVATEAAALRSPVLDAAVNLELLQVDPALAVVTARKNLDAHALEVTERLGMFAPAVLENCEMIFSAVLLKSKDEILLTDARQGLTRSDELRKFHASAMTAQARREEVKQGLPAGSLTKAEKKGPLFGEGDATWVGHLVHKPQQYPDTPFVVVRGDREVLVHSFDGRFYLRDFLGREVVVRGTWRKSEKTGKADAKGVVSLEEIRVLPRTARPE